MPSLKHLKCEIEWSNTTLPFAEHGTKYGDGVVETYIAIPDHPQPFAVRLTSTKYVADGLAMLVFMDGGYQCNRNRLDLQPPGPGSSTASTLVDMRVRQKEKSLGDGVYLGRGWRFDRHNTVSLQQLPANLDRRHFMAIGTISVFVLRCRAKSTPVSSPTTSSNVDDLAQNGPDTTPIQPSSQKNDVRPTDREPENLLGFMMDGPADSHHFGLDGEGSGAPADRSWSWTAPAAAYPPPTSQASYYVPGQPPQPPPPPTQHYYGDTYRPPFPYPQPWQPGPATYQNPSASPPTQRHVHFSDESLQPSSGASATAPGQNSQDQQQFHRSHQHVPQQQQGTHQPKPQHNSAPQLAQNPPLAYGYSTPYVPNVGIPTAQDQSRAFPQGVEASYQPPAATYQPSAYSFPTYPLWSSTPAHAQQQQQQQQQHPWTAQPMPAPSYPTAPSLATPLQSSYPYPYPQYTYPAIPAPSLPPHPIHHPGGGMWGPPEAAQPQDHGNDRPDQLDGQASYDPASNTSDQPKEENAQSWDQQDSWQTQTGDSNTNGNQEAGGNTQSDNWNSNSEQTAASNTNWDQPVINTAVPNDGDTAWNSNENQTVPAQDSWETSDNTYQPDPSTSTFPQQDSSSQAAPNTRPLWGPHGAYYKVGAAAAAAEGEPQPDAGEEPPYDVPADMSTTHQVKPGEGYVYYHKRRSPEYIDSLEDPYAHFIFKYRTKEQIEHETGLRVEDQQIEKLGDKRELQMLGKEELVEMVLQAKDALGGKIPPSDGHSHSGNKTSVTAPAAIPAPVYNFLHYKVPPARQPSKTKAPYHSPAAADQDISRPNPPTHPSHQNHQHQHHHHTPNVDSWGQKPTPQPPKNPSQPQSQSQSQSQSEPDPDPDPPIQPIQFQPQTQKYKSGTSTTTSTAPTAAPTATSTDRPISPPNGDWSARSQHEYNSTTNNQNCHYPTPRREERRRSSPSDNGMGGWDGGVGAGNARNAGNAGATGGASVQPSGGW